MPQPHSLTSDLANVVRGLLMGAADVVPGISGGTVALLLGIYPRLLAAISHVDSQWIGHLRRGRWAAAAVHIDLRFLATLAGGILLGILTLADVIHLLLTNYRPQTLAAFFGFILASGILVARMARPAAGSQAGRCVALGVLAAAAAAWLVWGAYLQPQAGWWYLFISGAIAICAMILPGVSGAYLLVLLGLYEPITEIVHHLKRGQVDPHDLATLAVFACGCVVGLLAFSKVLKALLARYYSETMSALGGLMIGSLVKVWPFQQPLDPADVDSKITEPFWPEAADPLVLSCAAIAGGAFALVLVVDAVAGRIRRQRPHRAP